MGELCWLLTEFQYYSYCTNPMEQEFFVPARPLRGVKLLISVFMYPSVEFLE